MGTLMLLRSIRSRLLGLVLATVVPFTALIGAGLWNQWRSDQAAAVERAIDEARLLVAEVDDHLANLDNLLTGLSRAVSWNPADTAANDALLGHLKSDLPDYVSAILLFSLDGTNIGTSSDPAPGRPNARDRSYFQQILAGERFAVGEVIRARPRGQWVVTVASPVRDRSGQLRAVLAIGTQLEHFQDALRIQRLPPGSVVRVVNEDGVVIAHSKDPADWIGRDLGKEESVAQHLAAKEASGIVKWPDGVERITGSATARHAPWLVSVGLPRDVALATIISRLLLGALFSASALAMAFAIAWMLSGHLVRPLRQLRKDATVLASGELSHRTTVHSSDEVGDLAEALNTMAARLEQRQDEARRAADDLRQANDTLAAVIDASPVAIVCSDPQRRIFLWSRAAEQIFGYTAEEALNHPINIIPPESKRESQALFERTMSGETIRDVHLKRMRKDGTLVDVRVASARMYNPDGTVRGAARAYEDITDRKSAERQLERIAHYDQLTGLPNRLTLQKDLGRLLSGGDAKKPTAIALFDLDSFKDVNDTLGHSTGDQLLIEVGHRVSDVTGSRGQVCRLGGDEFVVIFPNCGDPLEVGKLVEMMLKRLSEPFTINDNILHVGGSAGIAIAPNDGASVDELIANADLALYQAKSGGGRTYRFFLPVLRAQAQARRNLQIELRRAHEYGEFELYFQPQIRLADEAVVGAEALIRWRHPERGILAPGAFIETLAASTIAPEVSRWIMQTACQRASQWRAAGLPLGRVGVNLFPIQLGDQKLLRDIDDALRESGLPADALELEITENVALNVNDTELLRKVREKGVKLAFDDFGTGYASLSYLTKFPLSRIKIDRSFIIKITENADDAAIVRSLIAMAHNLGLEVIAEGVETAAQAAFLLDENCEEAQGYLFAKPLPAAEFEAYLKGKRIAASETAASETGLAANAKLQRRAKGPGRHSAA
jgi:diguanylate cyclase (GGDEF)-like protein/PAS domain S-box-containing protein